MRVDVVASQPHYVERIAPIWWNFSEDERGLVHISEALNQGMSDGSSGGNVVLAASYADARSAVSSRKIALLEHGVGQRYIGNHQAYAGGDGRRFISLFLCPNERVASLNRDAYPDIPSVVIGDIYLDTLDTYCWDGGGDKPWDVAVSFHADLADGVSPEAGTTWRYWEPAIQELAASGFKVLGHSHPRDRVFARSWFASMGIIYTESFLDVVRYASCYICDNSSTIYYAAAMGLPVVLLNSPAYRQDIEHGLRFWEFANIGWQVDRQCGLIPAIDDSVRYPYRNKKRVDEICAQLFPMRDSKSSIRAVDALRTLT